MPESHRFSTHFAGRELVIETGKLANLANGAVTVKVGDTLLLAAATMADKPREGIDFFPLSVDYEERLYAAGRIPGSFFRREGRPGEGAILTARLIDRPLRPLFPADFRNDVQIIVTPLSVDQIEQPDVLAIVAASAALTVSNIPFGVAPFDGPVGACRVGLIDGELVLNPTFEQMERSDLDLRMAGTRHAIVMVECGANEVPEATMVKALEFGHQAFQVLIDLQEQMAQAVGKPKKTDYPKFVFPAEVVEKVRALVGNRMAELAEPMDKQSRAAKRDALQAEVLAALATPTDGSEAVKPGILMGILHDLEQDVVRAAIIQRGARPDGRLPTQLRPLAAEVSLSPRAHGTGLFTRGETQVLTLATLGTPGDAQELDTLSPEDEKRYMHHYNFPPFSTGEVKPNRGQSRREVGHGALAERALVPVLPDEKAFPYTIRLVSEVLSSNGSTSMASVCGSTLALMDAGVPISAPVAGIAMGLIKDDTGYAILTDIQGLEDHLGDMDFKVAGTAVGITALQMDIKVKGLSAEILSKALEQARVARGEILEVITSALPAPRADLSPYAPRIITVKIDPDKIGAVIGPGGKNIRKLQEETKTKIDIDDDGTVYISGMDAAGALRARETIAGQTESVRLGGIYTGRVVRVESFGAFVEILPGQDGMVHISQLASERIGRVEDVANLGDELTVMVTGIDDNNKIRLSRQAVLEGWTLEEAIARDRKGGGGDRGGRDGGDRRGGGGGDRRGGYDDRRGGRR